MGSFNCLMLHKNIIMIGMLEICGREENQSGSTVARSKIHSKDKVSLLSEGITVVLKGSPKSNLEKREQY